jgi:hypothetical protein
MSQANQFSCSDILNGVSAIDPKLIPLARLFVKLTVDIFDKEGIKYTAIKIEPKKWRTSCQSTIDKKTIIVHYGEEMLQKHLQHNCNGSDIFYCIKLIDTEEWTTVKLIEGSVKKLTPSVKLASTLLEEIAHALAPYNSHHNAKFIYAFQFLWKRYFSDVKTEINYCIH